MIIQMAHYIIVNLMYTNGLFEHFVVVKDDICFLSSCKFQVKCLPWYLY